VTAQPDLDVTSDSDDDADADGHPDGEPTQTDPPDIQQMAADSWEPNLLAIAPPGCGKTELLAMRAVALISRLGPHQKILALTFTNRAKANLSDRLRQLLGPQRFRRYVTVHNFHGHATDLIKSHGRTLGLDPSALTFPTTQTLSKALKQFSADAAANRAAEELLGQVKRDLLDDDEVAAALDQTGDALALRVERERVEAGQLHYDDLLRHAQRLVHVDAIANLYHQHYGAVLVDEFQDLSLQQLDIVLRTCITWRTFVGDPLQGIYSWAGADPDTVEARLRALGGDPIELTVSYRSSPAVLNMVNGLSATMGATSLTAHELDKWADGGAAAALIFNDRAKEAEVVFTIAAHIATRDPAATVGIITRSAGRRTDIDNAFAATPQVPCRRWDLAIDDPLVRDRIRRVVAGLPRGATVDEARHAAIADLDPSDVDTAEDLGNAFDQLAEQDGADASARQVLSRYRHTEDDDEVAVGPGVHLLNAHTGKGQQFDWVFVCGLERGQVPSYFSKTPAAIAEEKRVLLVMLSRARHGLVVTRVKTADGRYGPFEVDSSPWFAGLQSAATMTGQHLADHINALYPDKEPHE
jgi:DNA helicase-2/ATP-dependent DNA helicase PcrA